MTNGRESIKDTLLGLMRMVGIPEKDFETTTLAQLALRHDARKQALGVHAKCGRCGAEYGLQRWLYLEPTGYFDADGERTRPAHRPELEGRLCECGEELRVAAPMGARLAVPLHEMG